MKKLTPPVLQDAFSENCRKKRWVYLQERKASLKSHLLPIGITLLFALFTLCFLASFAALVCGQEAYTPPKVGVQSVFWQPVFEEMEAMAERLLQNAKRIFY